MESQLKSLPLLQDRIKKDSEAYSEEFLLQYDHFVSSLELLSNSPQKADRNFLELVMFIAHTVSFFPNHVTPFVGSLENVLHSCSETIHPGTRHTIIKALLLLRTKRIVSLVQYVGNALRHRKPRTACIVLLNSWWLVCRFFPLFFELLEIPDKSLRRLLMNYIVRDITRNQLMRSKERNALQQYLLNQMAPKTASGRLKRVTKIAIELFRRGAWREPRLVNAIAQLVTAVQDTKVATAGAHFLLGNYTPLIEEDESSDDEMGSKKRHFSVGSKKTRGKLNRMEREKDMEKRKKERRERRAQQADNFSGGSILDMLHDPQSLAERLLARASRQAQKDPFLLRLLFLNVVSRLIGRYQLLVLGFYPLMQRFLNPRQTQITKVLAIFAQGCHELVPPDELRPVMRCLMDQFVAEYQTPEAMAVGLHAIREICERAPLALSEEMLADLAEFRRYKNKTVMASARSLINLYRDIYPGLLHSMLRGKTAAMEVSRNEAPLPEYGALRVATTIDGLDRLNDCAMSDDLCALDADGAGNDDSSSELLSGESLGSESGSDFPDDISDNEDGDDDDDDDDDDDGDDDGNENFDDDEEDTNEDGTSTLSAALKVDPREELLTEEHFAELARRRAKTSEIGGHNKRRGSTAISVSSDSEVSDNEDKDDFDVVRPESLESGIRKKGREYRLALLRKSKEEQMSFTERAKLRGKLLKASVPNSVQKRNKPLMMVKRKRAIVAKKHTDVASKLASLRAHVKTLKTATGKKRKYRRG